MALKADRHELQTDISFFCDDSTTTTRGGVVCHDGTTASGAAMDQGVAKVRYQATVTTSHVPVGILLNDVVNKDLTRTHLNHFKDEVQLGGKVTVLRKGWVVTNSIPTGDSPVAGSRAFVNDAGEIGVASNIGASGSLCIGRFLTGKDEDGYAKVEVNLPNFGQDT